MSQAFIRFLGKSTHTLLTLSALLNKETNVIFLSASPHQPLGLLQFVPASEPGCSKAG